MANNSIEILYCIASSVDSKGRRVIVREGSGTENLLWPDSDLEDASISLLALTSKDMEAIQQFFNSARS